MNKKRILVCDDQTEQRESLERTLQDFYDIKHSVHYKHLGSDLRKNGPIQLLILDLHFDGDGEPFAGRKAIPELVQRYPNLKIIIYSSILTQVRHQKESLEIARELLRYPQVVAFLGTGDGPARVQFEVHKALGTPGWVKDDELNILHISDVQFGGPGLKGSAPELASRITEAIEAFVDGDQTKGEDRPRRYPELLVFSGDLAQYGRPNEFAEAVELARAMSKFIHDRSPHMANLLQDNAIVIPGNHDVNWDISRARSLFKSESDWEYRPEMNSDLAFLHRYTWQPYCEATATFGAGPADWARVSSAN